MTLQQKLLAKQSKKGFTLVELVVVIAILGILAAIAIPAVVGIINSASTSQGESDASTLNSACKTLYAGIQSGTVNNDTSKDAQGTAVTYAAAKGASQSVRQAAADAATIRNAADYSGLYQGKADDALADFYVAQDGTIKFAASAAEIPSTDTPKIALGSVTFATTLQAVMH